MLTSLLWKLVYGVAAALALALTTFLESNTDPHLWSLKSLVVTATPLLASTLKKLVAGFLAARLAGTK